MTTRRFNRLRQSDEFDTKFVEATVILSPSKVFALAVQESDGGRLVQFLSNEDEISGLVALLKQAADEKEWFKWQ
ncbi:hypothetical protein ES705_34424 [subsurface metagenome]